MVPSEVSPQSGRPYILTGEVSTSRALLNANFDSAFLIDKDGCIVDMNLLAAKRLGVKSQELIGSNIFSYIEDGHQQQLKMLLSKIFLEKRAFQIEETFKDHFYDVRGFPILDESQKVLECAVYARDVTEKKLIEKKLTRAEKLYRSIFENTGTAMAIIDEDGTFSQVNANFCRIFGFDSNDIVGKINIFELISQSEKGRVETLIRNKLLSAGLSPENFETVIVSKSGEENDALFCWELLPDSNQSVISIQVTSPFKKAQRELRERERQLRALIDHLPYLAWIKDREGRFILVNEAYHQICGINPENIIGKTAQDFFPSNIAEVFIDSDRQALEAGRTIVVEEIVKDRSGNYFPVETTKSPICDDEGNVIGTVGIAYDITGWKEKLQLYKKKHEQLGNLIEQSQRKLKDVNECLIEQQRELAKKSREHDNLQEKMDDTKSALNVLVGHLEDIRRETEHRIVTKIKGIIEPLMIKLQADSYPCGYSQELSRLVDYMSKIGGSITRNDSGESTLTPTEMEVASMIRNGLSTETIAEVLHISQETVKTHRRNIRKKLKIQYSGANLQRYLESTLDPVKKG